MSNSNRVSSGVPTGGQFMAKAHQEPGVSLGGVAEFPEMPDLTTATHEDFRVLAEHPDPAVRAELTTNIRIPEDVLERFSEPDQDVSVRLAAVNTGYSGTAGRASNDEDTFVRMAAFAAWDVSDADRTRLQGDAKVQRLMSMIAH